MAMISDPLKCGNCGESKVELFNYRDERESRDVFQILVARCTGCKSKSIISVPAPKLTIDWGKDAEGILCGGWADEKKQNDNTV